MRLSETPPRFPKWIHIDQGAINGILNVLDFWSTVDNKFDTAGMLNHHVLENTTNSLKILEDNPHISPAYRQSIQESLDRKRKKAAAALDKFTDQQMRNVGLTPLPARASPREKEIFAQRREEVINKMIKLLSGNSGTMADEKDWYERTKVFLPPTCLWSRHPGFEVSRGLKTEAQLDAIDWKPVRCYECPSVRFTYSPLVSLRNTLLRNGCLTQLFSYDYFIPSIPPVPDCFNDRTERKGPIQIFNRIRSRRHSTSRNSVNASASDLPKAVT
jgi:hypothetical protein